MREIAEMMLAEARRRLLELRAEIETGKRRDTGESFDLMRRIAKAEGAVEALECLLAKC